jgi:hypothetical protein
MPNGKVYKGDTFAALLKQYKADRAAEDPTFLDKPQPATPVMGSEGKQ